MTKDEIKLGDEVAVVVTSDSISDKNFVLLRVLTVDVNMEVVSDYLTKTGRVEDITKCEEDVVMMFCRHLGTKPGAYKKVCE